MSEAVNTTNNDTNTSNYTQFMLSTIDNPYNPFQDFKKWFVYDEVVGNHHSSSLLAKHSRTSIDASDEERAKDIEQAIDEILLNDTTGIFIKVKGE